VSATRCLEGSGRARLGHSWEVGVSPLLALGSLLIRVIRRSGQDAADRLRSNPGWDRGRHSLDRHASMAVTSWLADQENPA
jgi:hypothetical protein